jgi:hypothetical protein
MEVTLLTLFARTKIDEWKILEKDAQQSINGFLQYLDRLLAKISLLQEIYLKIVDFDNLHFFEKNELKYVKAGHANAASPKLYRLYFNIIKRKLLKLDNLILQEFKQQSKESSHIHFVHKRLLELDFDDTQSNKIAHDIHDFEKKLEALEAAMRNESSIVQFTHRNFTRFVGKEMKWVIDHKAAGEKNKKYYADTLANKEQIFSEWGDFLENMNKIKSSLQREISVVVGTNPGDDIANWKVFVSNEFKKFEILKDLENILKKTRHIVVISKERMELYHATEQTSVLPLLESKYPHGFYFCIGKKKYASKIKQDLMQNQGWGSRMNVFTLSIPQSLFRDFALVDANRGNDRDDESIEAYEHAYFVPVSKYTLVNHYFNEGLIIQKD